MPSDPEGLAIARSRIAEEAARRTGTLDLGDLGLEELPGELFELAHLRRLNLGRGRLTADGELTNDGERNFEPRSKNNTFHKMPPALARLSRLERLWLRGTDCTDLASFAEIHSLTHLNCSGTEVADLSPLAALHSLTDLKCSGTEVTDLSPLAGLHSLTDLKCSGTEIADLSPLAGLHSLRSLDCSGTKVTDLAPLVGLNLRSLICWHTPIECLPDRLVWSEAFEELVTFETTISNIPAEILSNENLDNCLPRVRAHLRDLAGGQAPLPDVKVLVLGNGRVGKTQICRRLRGEQPEPEADSTHGITVTSADLALLDGPSGSVDGAPVRLNLWDFGGQEMYHGTHALFTRARAIFLLVWTPHSDNAQEHQHRGMTFRNRPLRYWLEYARGPRDVGDSPVIVVQNRCDRPEDEAARLPVPDELLSGLPFRKVVQYSALKNRGRPALDDALRQAAEWLRERHGLARIGRGRLAVKRRLEELREADAARPVEERRHRTLTQEQFVEICREVGGVSSPEHLLDYLHQVGVLFHQEGLFGDAIVLDQSWALEAIYVVFNRERCWRQLRANRGRFTRSLLDLLVWAERGYCEGEQELLLSMMRSCGVCFLYRQADKETGQEAEYIAPELLPARAEVELELEALWEAAATCEERTFPLPFYQQLMPRLIGQFGGQAGVHAAYWKQGLCLYEKITRSRAWVEARPHGGDGDWNGELVIRTQGDMASELLAELSRWVLRELRLPEPVDGDLAEEPAQRHHSRTVLDKLKSSGRPDGPEERGQPETRLEFGPPPRTGTRYCVSYAREDKSNKLVDDLCAAARARGIRILRDKDTLRFGESITRFMRQIGAGDRVFVILSEKYLKSENCMYELWELWRNSRLDPEVLRERARVYVQPDVRIGKIADRLRHAKHWKDQFADLSQAIKECGTELLGEVDFKRYRLMKDFALHVSDILQTFADTLQPRDFAQLVTHGFDD